MPVSLSKVTAAQGAGTRKDNFVAEIAPKGAARLTILNPVDATHSRTISIIS
jgi:hypothetical protein